MRALLEKNAQDDAPTPLMDHLVELRNRLVWCVGVLLVASVAAYFFAADIYGFLVEPLAQVLKQEGKADHRLIYTNLTEAFFTYLGVAVWAGFVITAPFILWQVWRFVAPGLYGHERKLMLPYLLLTPLLFLAGAALAYYLVFPAAFHFFVSFENPAGPAGLPIQLEARVGEYLGLAMTLILAFGLSFEIPLGLVLAVQVGLISTAQLKQFRRYAIVLNFVVAAIITPPDVLSQLALAIPLVLLYELAIVAAGLVEKKKDNRQEHHA